MPKQLYVNLKFTADADQAKKQIQDLTQSLQKISLKTPSVIDDQQLKKAASAANELQRYLAAAVNVDTGKINLSEFSRQLNKSNRSLTDIYNDLKAIGPEGVSAFNKLSQSLIQAETHSNKLHKKMTEFANTLKNTLRWQVSSSILHGLQGAVQSAFYYAQDLDKSLNNIRIVTGQSADQMAQFAKQANAAAQSLSTTTTAYTDAALIYYQQGLNDEEVKARTDITVKMANVTGESAEQISEQLTAVWNNFYDGSQSLESFSDKMVALGAATASSSSEISAGLNQFAATANTVGLSFDYAAAALATVTATTRQSANVVGNSFKTLFARLEGLSLGETLDDGTTLNKYSAALEKVGISIKDQNGELKAMDTILDELGSRWQTLSKDQQVALAQTVGGVRQYTQLIALMDNWDFMQENLSTVRGSEGALQEQQEIYEEGWQAAAKRVKAALEGIYDTLIDDQKLKKLYDFGATALNSINGIIKGLGGVKGILTQVASIVLQLQAKNMGTYLNQIKDGFMSFIGKSGKSAALEEIEKIYSERSKVVDFDENPMAAIEVEQTHKLAIAKQELIEKEKTLSDAEKIAAEQAINDLNAKYEALKREAGQKDILSKQNQENLVNNVLTAGNIKSAKDRGHGYSSQEAEDIKYATNELIQYQRLLNETQNLLGRISKQDDIWKTQGTDIKTAGQAMQEYLGLLETQGVFSSANDDQQKKIENMRQLAEAAAQGKGKVEDILVKWREFNAEVTTPLGDTQITSLSKEVQFFYAALTDEANGLNVPKEALEKIMQAAANAAKKMEELKDKTDNLGKTELPVNHMKNMTEGLSQAAASFTALWGAVQGIAGAYDTLTDKTASTATRISAVISGATSGVMGLIRGFTMAQAAVKALNLSISTGPLIVITAIATAIMGLITIISRLKDKKEEEHRAAVAQAEEQLEKQKEIVKSYQDQLKNLSQLENKYDSLGQATDGYINNLKSLIEEYDIENGQLMLLQKNYKGLEDAIYSKYKAELETEKQDTIKALVTSTGKQYKAGNEAQYARDMLPKYQAQLGVTTASQDFSKEAQEQIKVLKELKVIKDSVYREGTDGTEKETRWLLDLANFNFTNEEDFNKLKEALQGFKDAAPSTANLTDIDAILTAFDNKDFTQAIKYLQDLQSTFKVEETFIDPRSFESLDDIHNAFKKLQKDGVAEKQILQGINQFLGKLGSEYVGFMQKMSSSGITDPELIQQYLDEFKTLTDEERTIFFNVQLDAHSKSSLTEEIEQWKHENAVFYIEAKINFATSAEEAWKKDMSSSEINDWINQFGELFENSDISIPEFLMQDFDDQKDWLAQRVIELKPDFVAALLEENEALDKRLKYFEETGIASTETQEAQKKAIELMNEIAGLHGGAEIQALKAEKEAELQAIYEKYPEILENGTISYEALNEQIETNAALAETEGILWAKNIDSVSELEEALNNDTISATAFNLRLGQLKDKLDDEIDTEDWEQLADYLKENQEELKGFTKEANVQDRVFKRIAQSILRFDNAVKEINDHYEDWMDALESGNAQEAAEAAEQMRDTYADLMDLPFDTLSADFLQNTENLKLMQTAATGDEEAYRQLQAAVREDIVGHLRVDKADWDTQYQTVLAEYDRLNGLEDLEVGASINDQAFIDACNEMIAAAGMTADQATNFLASMGVDAELETHPTTVKRTSYNWIPPEYSTLPIKTGFANIAEATYLYPYMAQSGRFEPVTEEETVNAVTIKANSAKKSSGGNFKSNNSSAGGGGSKGGGGGGGSKKTGSAEHAKKQPNDKAGDRYHVINNQIEDLAKQYDKLSEAEERAFGKSRLELMNQKTKLLTKQYQAQQKLRKEAEEYLKLDLKNLQSGSFDSDGDGKNDTFGANRYKDKDGNTLQAILDENGTILNYDELIQAADDYYNAKVDAYNRWLDENYIDKEINDDIEEEKKQLEEQVKNEETYRENFLGLIKQYEDTQDKVQEEINKEIQAYHDVLNQKLENTEYAVQMRIDVDEDSLKLLDFLMKMLEDSPYKAAEAMANLTEQFAVGEDEIEAYKEGLQDLFNNHFSEENGIASKFKETMEGLGYVSGGDIVAALTAGGDDAAKLISTLGSMGTEFTDEEIATIRNYSENLQNEVVNLTQIRQDMFEQLDSAINQTNDDLDRQRNKIEKSTKVLEHYDNIIDLIGRDTAGLSTQDMITNAEHQLTVLNAQTAADKAIMDEAQAVYDRLLTEQGMYEENTTEWYLWKQRVEEAEDRLEETTENYYSSWEAALQGIKDKFSQTMELMAEDYSNTLGGTAGNLEGLQNLMDQYEKTHSTYVPEYERVYQLNKLNAEAIKAIDETNNIKAKKQLQEYQQKILEAQESGREMSEYELANLEKELALRQAALGLEEARNVKSQVRMSRDNEGNYSYIYTADEDAVGEAESNYRDKLYEMQKANAEYINEIQNNIVSLQQDCVNAIQQAADIYGEGTVEYENAINKITQYYNDAMAAQFSELELAMANNQSLQEFDAEFHHLMTNDKMVSDTGYITNFKQTLYSELTGIEDSEKANTIWAETVAKARETAIKAGKDYSTELEKAMNAAGKTLTKGSTDLANFAKSATTEFGKAAKAADNDDEKNPGLKQTIAKLAQDAKDKLLGEDGKGGLVGTVSKFVSSTETAIKNLQTTIAGLTSSLDEVIKKLTGVGDAVDALNEKELNVPSTEGTPSSGDGDTNGTTTPSTGNGNSGNSNETQPTNPKTLDETNNTSSYKPTSVKNPLREEHQYSYKNDFWHTHTVIQWYDDSTSEIKSSKDESHTCKKGFCTKCKKTIGETNNNNLSPEEQRAQNGWDNGNNNNNNKQTNLSPEEQRRNGGWFASGGYTGSWGTEGKLAVLHEKELVLNREDTENMLAAVSMIRQISDVIDLNAQSAGGLFSSLFSANVSMNNEPLEQNVHITAEFPNATDKDEILAAFDNVINLASQYANRKSPSVNKLSAQLF